MADTPATPKDSEYLVTGSKQITKLIGRIIVAKKPVTVYFNSSRDTYSTVIFSLSNARGSCFIDPLVPASGNQLLREHQSASVQCNLAGITTWFAAGEILSEGTTDDQPWLEMALPQRAWYQQRRNAFRAQAFGSLELSVLLYSRNRAEPIAAKIEDLSVSGCRVSVAEVTPPFEENELFYRCQLYRAGGQVISCEADIRHSEASTPPGSLLVGLRFIQPTPQQDALLSQLVIQLERSLNQPQLLA